MPDTTTYLLRGDFRPGELVCYGGRMTAARRAWAITALPMLFIAIWIYGSVEGAASAGLTVTIVSMLAIYVALRWSIPVGEVIITDQRILWRFNKHGTSSIARGQIEIAQLIGHINFQYYRLTLADGAVHRIFVLGNAEAFADCLPPHVRVYKSKQDAKGGNTLRLASKGLAIVGMLMGLCLGMLTLYALNEAFDGIISSEFWSVVVIVSLLFGPMITGAYFGFLLGITLAIAQLKNRLTLGEAKESGIFSLALDFGAPPGITRLTSNSVAPHLERTLSNAYGKVVRLP